MAKFNYIAMDAAGKEVRGSVEASSQAQAIAQIRAQNLFPTAIGQAGGGGQQAGAAKPASAKGKGMKMEIKLPSFLKPKVKQKDLTTFTRQLATLMDAGLPLLRSLRVLPKIFDNLFVNMIKAGEAGGVTELVLKRLSEFMEKAEKIKNKVKGAMIYPSVILCAAIGITVFLLLTVIPKFEEIFSDLLGGASLPQITQVVIGISNVLQNYFLYVAVAVAAFVILIKVWAKTKGGRYVMDRIAVSLPVFGTLTRRTCISRLTRTLGTLLSSGVPMLQALGIVRDTSGNAVYYNALQTVHDGVKEGENMSGLMEQTKAFPPMVVSMVDVGEETGAIAEMLTRIADTYEDEVDNAVAGLTSIIEPVMIIFLALIVGSIVIAMFLPLVSIVTQLGAA